MKYLQIKTNKVLKIIVEWELSRFILKFLAANVLLSYEIRQFAVLTLAQLPLQGSVVGLKLRCAISNQSRSVFTFFKLNRMRFKILATRAMLMGLKKN